MILTFQEFFLPEGYNYKNIVSVTITGCTSANLDFSSFPEAENLEELIVQNISGTLNFDAYIASNRLKLLKLSNIGRIPKITNQMFTSKIHIDTILIENTLIEDLEEDFSYFSVLWFIMINVTIERVDMLNISTFGSLHIKNSELRNIKKSLTFANFVRVEIIDSRFEMQNPGLMTIQSTDTIVQNSIFSDVSMNLVSSNAIRINDICAHGKSTLRLSSKCIESTDNRLPNEIAYRGSNEECLMIRDNIVCKAGNCKCTNSNGSPPCRATILLYIFSIGFIFIRHI